MVTKQNPHVVPHDNNLNMLIWSFYAPICYFSVIRIANIWMQQQFQELKKNCFGSWKKRVSDSLAENSQRTRISSSGKPALET